MTASILTNILMEYCDLYITFADLISDDSSNTQNKEVRILFLTLQRKI